MQDYLHFLFITYLNGTGVHKSVSSLNYVTCVVILICMFNLTTLFTPTHE